MGPTRRRQVPGVPNVGTRNPAVWVYTNEWMSNRRHRIMLQIYQLVFYVKHFSRVSLDWRIIQARYKHLPGRDISQGRFAWGYFSPENGRNIYNYDAGRARRSNIPKTRCNQPLCVRCDVHAQNMTRHWKRKVSQIPIEIISLGSC